jgi:hypothetical protein
MAISFLGSNSGRASGASISVSLSGLSLQENDFVLVINTCMGNSDRDMTMNTAGYTSILDIYVNGTTSDSNMGISWKVMGSTPDSTVSCKGSSSANFGGGAIAYAFRGVDTSNPIDVTTTSATASGSSIPNPPSITPFTSGAFIVIAGSYAATTPDTTVTVPTGYSNQVLVREDPSWGILTAVASKAWTSGAEDPAAWTDWTTEASGSWTAATVALRPLLDSVKSPLFYLLAGMQNA